MAISTQRLAVSPEMLLAGTAACKDALEDLAERIFRAMAPNIPVTRTMKEHGAQALTRPIDDDDEMLAALVFESMLEVADPPCRVSFLALPSEVGISPRLG
jgi:hypothetical protein